MMMRGGAMSGESGAGAVLNSYVPVREQEQSVGEENMEDATSQGKGTILLVDDEEMILEVTREILTVLGYRVLVAGGGEEAIKICAGTNGAIDLVILDMMMPAMGGKETFDGLREIRPDLKIILSSGYGIEGQPTEILEKGCNGFIQKPFTINDLSAKIGDVLKEG